jgi:hypothetical protein
MGPGAAGLVRGECCGRRGCRLESGRLAVVLERPGNRKVRGRDGVLQCRGTERVVPEGSALTLDRVVHFGGRYRRTCRCSVEGIRRRSGWRGVVARVSPVNRHRIANHRIGSAVILGLFDNFWDGDTFSRGSRFSRRYGEWRSSLWYRNERHRGGCGRCLLHGTRFRGGGDYCRHVDRRRDRGRESTRRGLRFRGLRALPGVLRRRRRRSSRSGGIRDR